MSDARYADFDWDVARSRARGTKRWSVYGPDVLDLTVAEMDLPIAPPIATALADAVRRETVGYPVPAPLSGLPEIAAEWLSGTHGLAAEAGEIRLLPELMRGITHSIRLFTPAGSPVVVPTPTYRSFFGAVELADRAAVEVPMLREDDGYRLDLDAIDAELGRGARTVLLCHPANPVGRVFTPRELTELAELVERHGARVISDEIHAPLRYGTPFTPYAAVGGTARNHSVTLFSATKAWNIPGLRCGFLALTNPADHAKWAKLPGAATGGISPLGMLGSAAAFGHGADWLRQALRFLSGNRALLGELFTAAGLPELYTAPEATYLAWLDLRALGVADPAAVVLEKTGVATTPGPDHGRGGDGFVRLNFATAPDVLEDAVTRIAKLVATGRA
ncbi:MalY/PatB family protein [Amycolatopsis jiangsuensis]|uniref:cysteine-S-conjugate beta-lyase n=1 Tax=Amycolatopsis jiangsuensis TaxID=1181879 RepID=A0A840IQL7_9PSEU|nr:aminotransferase class I/II-fold pyridoxal phosphate-dependent enzyme [Amycolatopsis jiangsuensis]MBB4683839.1 cystathionine beta-lyase [Amycolatopsis jiangsuensis]